MPWAGGGTWRSLEAVKEGLTVKGWLVGVGSGDGRGGRSV